ncbi:MAG TPA: tetratricopeptide repeat protein [Burkholderiales bacterium]
MLQDALAHHQAGRLREAEALYRALLEAEPGNSEALHLLGVAAHQLGRHEEAVGLIGRAIAANPSRPEFHSNLGEVQRTLGRHAEAERCFRAALALDPDLAAAHGNLGHALLAQQRHEAAAESYARAAALDPRNAAVLVNLAFALIELGRLPEAERRCRQALALVPGDAEPHQFLAIALAGLERFDEAADSYRRALALKPDYLEAHLNFAQLQLMRGEYAQGWRDYAWRWQRDDMPRAPESAGRLWSGAEDLRGRSILLQAEQGLGDTLHFARYAPLVAAKGAKVFLKVPEVLAPFLKELGDVNPAPRTDFYCPLLSLPAAFQTTVDTIPAAIPYLKAHAGDWRARLGGDGRKLVGLCWRGNPQYKGDRHRSMSLEALEPLFAVPGVRFVSLQKELHAHERRPELAHPGGDFASTASLVAALDLVISVDTVWAHWAGAIGKPLWLLLSRQSHWCWLWGREDSPWYPSAKLFRQPAAGDWASVVERLVRELGRHR